MKLPDQNIIWLKYPLFSYSAANLLLVLCYYLGAELGFLLAFANSQVSPIWPPEGFALAALFVGGYRLTPGIFIGAFLANYFLNPHLPTAILIAFGNTGSNLIGYWLYSTFSKSRYPFSSFRSTLLFFLLTIPGSLFSAGIGVSSLYYFEFIPAEAYLSLLFTWSMGEQQGFWVVSSALLAYYQSKKDNKAEGGQSLISQILTATFIVIGIIFISQYVFSVDSPIIFLPLPLLIFTTLYFRDLGAASSILGVSFTAVFFTVQGQGPFVSEKDTLNTTLMYLDAFIFSVSAMCFLLLSILKERESAQRSSLANLNKRLKESERIAQLSNAFRRYVPEEFLDILGKKNIAEIQLGDQVQRDMTVLFVDIRNFTELSEQMSPKDNFNFINGYLKRVSPCIHQNEGFVDKFIGDAIMALFSNAEKAIHAAISMQDEIKEYNKQRAQKQRKVLQIGIGIHSGSLMLGTIGEKNHMETTVISDAVNLASRMEGLTKIYGSDILVSETTLSQVIDPLHFEFRLLDKVRVKGKKGTVSVVEVIGLRQPGESSAYAQTKESFEKGMFHYLKKEFGSAALHFDEVLKINPADKPAELYLRRSNYLHAHGTPKDWDGIEDLDIK